MTRRSSFSLSLFASFFVGGTLVHTASADSDAPAASLDDSVILENPNHGFRIQSIATRITAFDQYGQGYQSQAGPLLGPGSERTTILEPQVEVVASQGDRLTHRFWVPIDIVTAASPDAVDSHRSPVDVISSASRQNTAGTFDWTATYRADANTDVSIRSGLHLEEPFRSWHGGAAGSHAFNDGSTVLSGSVLAVFDWFDQFDIQGFRSGRTTRSSTTGTVGVTQILTPTTLVGVNYGLTVQEGQLGNTWNVVPLATDQLGPELLPTERVRHAFVARLSQFLPWNGALHIYYRYYRDDWGLDAHSVETEVMQRILPSLYVGATYRFHTQTGVAFFTTLANANQMHRTADSDLAPLDANTIGGKIVMDLPMRGEIRALHVDLGYERYVRSNDLQVSVLTWGTGYRF